MIRFPPCLSPLVVLALLPSSPPLAGEGPAEAPPQTQSAPAVSGPSDEVIQAAVEEALARDADIAGHADLRVRCEEGILTLSGEVETLHVLRQAERRAGDARGVLDVVSNARVTSAGAPDPQILLEIQRVLDIPAFRGDSVAVAVADGRVRLSGTAATYARKLLADRAASEVPGVVEIVNNLRVVAPPEGDDTELARRILLLLTGGLTPVPGSFEVTVRNGVATLRGRVPLFSHRIQAERLALSVGGVTAADNRLKVDPSLAAPKGTVEVTP